MTTSVPPPLPVRSARARLAGLLESLGYLRRWLLIGAVIGLVAGVGAIVFFEALRAATHGLLGSLGGYRVPEPVGEGGGLGSGGFARPWAIPLLTTGGGLAAGLLVWRFAPEAEGHGTDAAISAVHHNPKGIRARVSLVKIIASALTIGSGGSGGREGPTAQISAGFGSLLARFLNLSPDDARVAVSVGVASGIGAIFRAPLGGAVLGGELLYRDDVEVEALIPSLVASVVAFAVFGAVEGYNPIFGAVSGYSFSAEHLVYFAAVGIAAGLMGRLYARSFYSVGGLFRRIRLPAPVKPAVGGLVVGLMGLVLPEVLGTGYGFLQKAMGDQMGGLSLLVVVALPFAKILATSTSIGSGGSGGIFGPGMVIGGFTGAAVYRLLAPVAPGLPHQAGAFAIVGMVACFGAIAHAPLAVILMVAEMTGSLSLLVPAMIAIALAVLVVGDATIYRSQLRNRAESPAHRFAFALPLAATVPVTEAMSAPRLVIRSDLPADDALVELRQAGLPGGPVVDGEGRWRGMILTEKLAGRLSGGEDGSEPIGRLADTTAVTVPAEATLDAAITALATGTRSWVSVIDNDGKVVGIVGTTDVLNGYRMALQTSLRQLGRAGRGTVLVEETIAATAPVVGKAVHELNLPPGTVFMTVQRSNQLLFVSADTVLEAGDHLALITKPSSLVNIRAALGAEPRQEPGAETPLV